MKPASRPARMRFVAAYVLLAAATLAATLLGWSVVQARARASREHVSRRFVSPFVLSSQCGLDLERSAACTVVERYFQALNTQRFGEACSLLGEALREQTASGGTCTDVLAFGWEPRKWGILAARPVQGGVAVLVEASLRELDHLRLLEWRALVGLEQGRARVLATSSV